MATGDKDDFLTRIKSLLPRWFVDVSPVLNALLSGFSFTQAFLYSLIGYAKLQVRIKTATNGWLDMIAADFFGNAVFRKLGQSDSSFRSKIIIELFRERATRSAIIKILTDLTGQTPDLLEPQRANDYLALGGYNTKPLSYNGVGAYASNIAPYQAYVVAYRPTIASGLIVSDADIYAAIDSVKPVGTIVWTRIVDRPYTYSVTNAAAIPIPLMSMASAPLPDGKVLSCGGDARTGTVVASAQIYDPNSDSWTNVSPMPIATEGHRAVSIGGGKIFVCGGGDLRSGYQTSYIFDANLNNWQQKTSMPAINEKFSISSMQDGKVFMCGGYLNTGATGNTYIYNPNLNIWTAMAAMPIKVHSHAACMLPNGKILVCGGVDDFNRASANAYIYNPITNSWTQAASLPVKIYGHTLSMLPLSGLAILIGGLDETNKNILHTPSNGRIYIYDYKTDMWSFNSSFTGVKFLHSASVLGNGSSILVCGGYNDGIFESTNIYTQK